MVYVVDLVELEKEFLGGYASEIKDFSLAIVVNGDAHVGSCS